ncbi:MAG: hypothetical protein ABI432_16050 [Flavobacteriales bacterium]
MESSRNASLLLLGLLCAAMSVCPQTTQAKTCTSFTILCLTNASGVETMLDLPAPQANGTYNYGTIRLLPGDQLLLKVRFSGDVWECTSQVTRDGGAFMVATLGGYGQPTYDVSALGSYAAYNTTTTLNPDGSTGQRCTFTVAQVTNGSAPIDLLMRVGCTLEGARNTTGYGMRNDLALLGQIPCSEPYSALGYPTSAAGIEQVDGCADLFVQKQIVDWVHIELRDPASPSAIVASANGLLSSTGVVVSTDGISPVHMTAPPGDYRLLVEHRNHLGFITDQAIPFRGQAPVIMSSPSGGLVVFYIIGLPLPLNPTCAGGTCTMRLGNTNSTGSTQCVSYMGQANDRDPILLRIGGSPPTNLVTGYYMEDVNMDGVVKYVGANNDRDLILQAIGGSIPTNVVVGQTP